MNEASFGTEKRERERKEKKPASLMKNMHEWPSRTCVHLENVMDFVSFARDRFSSLICPMQMHALFSGTLCAIQVRLVQMLETPKGDAFYRISFEQLRSHDAIMRLTNIFKMKSVSFPDHRTRNGFSCIWRENTRRIVDAHCPLMLKY